MITCYLRTQDQWRNSGGRKGATVLRPTDTSLPPVTRRYGVVKCRSTGATPKVLRYHEYFMFQSTQASSQSER